MMLRFLGIIMLLLLSACGRDQQVVMDVDAASFLAADEAFMLSTEIIDSRTIKAQWKIADGYHLYKDKFQFALDQLNVKIENVEFPQPALIEDAAFGKQEAYTDKVEITLTLSPHPEINDLTLFTISQGCSGNGPCYPPVSHKTKLKFI